MKKDSFELTKHEHPRQAPYSRPKVEVINFSYNDIIATSGCEDDCAIDHIVCPNNCLTDW